MPTQPRVTTHADVGSAEHGPPTPGEQTPAAEAVAVKVRIKTDPPGATVKENGVAVCESTPCDVVYAGADADPLREHRLTLTRQGWRAKAIVVRANDGPVVAKLSRAADNVRADPSPR
jgi:hypothetical protein